MLTMNHTVAGEECAIHVPERRDDLEPFYRWRSAAEGVLCVDSETSDLDVYTRDHQLRTVQFGDRRTAWVLRKDLFRGPIIDTLRQPRLFTAHNASFDLQVIDRHLAVTIEDLADRVFDTRIMLHLLDPRTEGEGGTGLSLKPASSVYVDPDAVDTSEGLSREFSRMWAEFKKTAPEHEVAAWTKRFSQRPHMAYGFSTVPLDHPLYLRYAGLDVIYGRRLFDEVAPLIRDAGLEELSRFEHLFASLLAVMQRRGVLVDVPYTRELTGRLLEEAERFKTVAARYGVANVNSTKQVASALEAMGEHLTERTKTGWKVDKEVLMPLADLDRDWARIEARDANPLADAVLRSKRAEKWATAYAEAFLTLRDASDRLHPSIGALQARTARMSVSRPPLQQLPSGDWTIRRALIADPGHLIIASDYSQVEMRVLAALCRDETLMEAILSGEDLHDFTARRVFGEGFTKHQRKVAKSIGFGKVYGGGLATIVRQTGADPEGVREALGAYDATFPGIKRFANRLIRRAEFGKREVVTPSGRHLPLDRDRLYAATNYIVQSTARDILAQAIVDIFDAGMGGYLLLPVHDELIAQAPAAEAAEAIAEIGRIMDGNFGGIPIISDPEVYGPSWGHGYGAPA